MIINDFLKKTITSRLLKMGYDAEEIKISNPSHPDFFTCSLKFKSDYGYIYFYYQFLHLDHKKNIDFEFKEVDTFMKKILADIENIRADDPEVYHITYNQIVNRFIFEHNNKNYSEEAVSIFASVLNGECPDIQSSLRKLKNLSLTHLHK